MPRRRTPETQEQQADRLYKFIHDYLKENAMAPSQREMAQHLKCSTKTIQPLLDYLEQSGRAIHRVKGAWRRIWVPIRDMPPEEV